MILNCSVEKTLIVPWTAKRSNQSILKEINAEYSLEGLMLKLQYFGHLMQRSDSWEKKSPDAGQNWGQEKKGVTEDEMVGWYHWLNGHEFEQTLGDSEGQGSLGMLQSMGSQRVRHDWATEQQLSSTGRGLALGMAGSRGSDSVRSSSHFSPLLLFLVVVFTDLPKEWQHSPYIPPA